MKLTIIGCAGSYPGPESSASCYLLEHDGFRLVVDMGNGSLGSLQRFLDPRDIDAIALSHLHPDHCLDMTSLHVLAKYHPDGPYNTVDVWAPEGAEEFLRRANGVDAEPMTDKFVFKLWDPGMPVSIGPFTVKPWSAQHPVPAYSLRISAGGRTITYTGDTGPYEQLADAVREADLFLSEASFLESRSATNPPALHLTGTQAATYARQAGAKRLVITHVPAWIDSDEVARDVEAGQFDGPVEFAAPGKVFDLS